MKKAVLTFNILILCTLWVSGQKTISKDDYEIFLNYANSQYVKTFIGSNDQEIWAKLENVSLDSVESIPDFKEISTLLKNNVQALELARTINERKEKYDIANSDLELISEFEAKKWYTVDLTSTSEDIIASLTDKLKIDYGNTDKIIENKESGQAQQIHSQVQIQSGKSEQDSNITEYTKYFRTIIIIVIISYFTLVILLVVSLYIWKKRLRDYIIKQVLNSQRIAKRFTHKDIELQSLSEKDISTIVEKEFERISTEKNETKKVNEVKSFVKTSKTEEKYLKSKTGKIFKRVEPYSDNSFFKLSNEIDNEAYFEFCGDEAEAIAKRVFSDDICIIVSGNPSNARFVFTEKPGRVKRVNDQWEVIEPIQIKLI